MATITQYKCPVCMLQSHTGQFIDRTALDPADFGWIITQECRGRKGFPTIGKQPLIDRIDEFPEIYERLKDVCLGLINAFYNHDLIKPDDLVFINRILDTKEEKISELKDRVSELVKKFNNLLKNYNLLLDNKTESLDNLKHNLKHQHNKELDNAVENLSEEYEQKIAILKDKIYKLQSLLNDYEVEGE